MKAMEFIKDSKIEFVKKEVEVTGSNGKVYKIKVSEKIKDTDIMKIIEDMVDRSKMCTKEKIEFDIVMTLYILIIKYFTDIRFEEYSTLKKQFSYELEMLRAMVDLGVFEETIKHIPEGEVNKIREAFDKYRDNIKKINNEIITQEILNGGDEDGNPRH